MPLCSCLEDTLPSMLLTMRLFVSLCPLLSDSAEVRHHPAGTIIAVSWHRSVNTRHHNMLGIYASVVCQLQDYSKGRWKVRHRQTQVQYFAGFSCMHMYWQSLWRLCSCSHCLLTGRISRQIQLWRKSDENLFMRQALYACGTCWLT